MRQVETYHISKLALMVVSGPNRSEKTTLKNGSNPNHNMPNKSNNKFNFKWNYQIEEISFFIHVPSLSTGKKNSEKLASLWGLVTGRGAVTPTTNPCTKHCIDWCKFFPPNRGRL